MGFLTQSKSKSTSAPWAPAQPALENALSEATRLYSGGSMSIDPYTGQRVARYSSPTMSGYNDAIASTRMNDRQNAGYNAMISGTALNAEQNAGYGDLVSAAGSGNDAALNARNDQIVGATMGGYNDLVSGDGMYRDFDRIRAIAADNAKAQTAGMFAGMGALNGGLAARNIGEGVADAVAQAEYDAYNAAENRRLQALGMAPTMQGVNFAGADRLRGIAMDQAGARLAYGDAQRAAGLDQAAAQLAFGDAQQASALARAEAKLAKGQALDAREQAMLDAQMQRYYEQRQAPIDALGRYIGMSTGLGGMGGTSVGKENDSPLGTLGKIAGSIAPFV